MVLFFIVLIQNCLVRSQTIIPYFYYFWLKIYLRGLNILRKIPGLSGVPGVGGVVGVLGVN